MGSLRFESIKLVGFKSFVEPTLFQIEPGLTGVVGPNGCGKSNLLEAIRWVMGANSAKAMRGAAMDDVIFNGTKTRPGRGQASVTLKINNSARIAPSMFNDDDELEISRVITKGSGSKYKVNGKTVRAKDIQLLFADASTGANSPALVRQGQINELISAKPSNRRRILEEAAGISGLHSRRHEAELRLRAAENNLERLDDILGQIESQLLSLRRQSRQATRYKKLAGDIREYKALLWIKRWELTLTTLTDNTEILKDNETQVQDLTAQVARQSAEVATITAKLEPHREEQIIAAAVCGRLNAAKEALDKDAQAAESEIKKLEARLDFLKGDIEREDGIVADAASAGEKLSEEQGSLKSAKDMSGAIAQAQTDASRALEQRANIETQVNDLNKQLATLSAQTASAERETAQASTRKSNLENEISSVEASLSRLDSEAAGADDLNLFSASLSDAASALVQARDDEQTALTAKQTAEMAERNLREELSEAKQKRTSALATQNALQAVVNNSRDDSEWVSALEKVSVKKGYEAALAAAFGEDLDAGLDENLPLSWRGASLPSAALPNGAPTLAEYVRAPEQLAARLSQIGVVDSDIGARLAKQLSPGQRLVSTDGDLWRWDGYYASSGMPSPAALKLENINKLEDIGAALPALTQTVETLEQTWTDARSAREKADATARSFRDKLSSLAQDERSAQASLSRYETDQARKTEQKNALADRLTRLQSELGATAERLASAEKQRANSDEHADLEDTLLAETKKLASARANADETSAAYLSLKNEAEARASRLATVEQDIADWQRRAQHAKERITSLHGREAETKLALTAAHDSPDEFAQKQQAILTELSEAESRRGTASDALAQVENALRTADGEMRQLEQSLGGARETRAASQARKTAAQERKEEVQARIHESLSCAPDELKELLEDLSPDSKMLEGDIERKLERLGRERENMGAVNLRADEEATEQEERLSALNDERQDLIGAIAKLREGIESLNAEGRQRLLDAFDTVNAHFGRLFVTLFGGGHASLALTESDDPLEAGLEVMVSPPGKKLGSMSLMSGGEQALTATALIFAVFLSNPAPICVLDEVDAPLDDANVDRYCGLLEEMCKQTETKFIAITHNPVTMARMDRLFGVTMAEKGVSQLVSIDLKEAEKLTA